MATILIGVCVVLLAGLAVLHGSGRQDAPRAIPIRVDRCGRRRTRRD